LLLLVVLALFKVVVVLVDTAVRLRASHQVAVLLLSLPLLLS
jgi:hypothetical protein